MIAERKNRSIVEIAWCMLDQFGMPHFLWKKPCHTSVHILDMCSHNSLRDVTHEDAFLGVNPYVDYFRVLCSLSYSYITFDKRKNLEATSKICIFVGYKDEYKYYRMFVPNDKNQII